MGIKLNPPTSGGGGPVNWGKLKEQILKGLDVAEEYRRLGVRFSGGSPNAKGWWACHAVDRPDEHPSAAVHIPSGVYCDKGGEGGAVGFLDFALKHGDFGRWIDVIRHYAEVAGVPFGTPATHGGGRIREAIYEYLDERGELRYAVFRYRLPNGRKSFTQHPPDGKGGWKLGAGCMEGVEPLPYRLPDLIAADPAEEVYIVEGEKDVERLVAEGFLATTNHQGANSTDQTWPKFVHHFRDRTCIILPDNDRGGHCHTRKVAGYLHGVTRSVKVVELPGLAPKGDVSDWLDTGGTAEELCQLCHEAPEWMPEVEPAHPVIEQGSTDPRLEGLPPSSDLDRICMADIIVKPLEWLWPDRIPRGKLSILAGDAKLGKSFLALDLAARVSAGLEIPNGGGECMERGSVIFFTAEDDFDDTIVPRLMAAEADLTKIHTLENIFDKNGQPQPFSLAHIPYLERMVSDIGDVRYIAMDPVTGFHSPGTDDNKTTALRAALAPLRKMSHRWGIATLLLSHFNKGNGQNVLNKIIGSQGYGAIARAIWVVLKDAEDKQRRQFVSAGNNLCFPPSGLAFRVHETESRIVWEHAPVLMDADEAMRKYTEQIAREAQEDKESRHGGKSTKLAAAEEWLKARFPTTPGVELPSDLMIQEGKQAGFLPKMIHAARKNLGIWARKSPGEKGIWIWYRPASTADSGPQPPQEDEA